MSDPTIQPKYRDEEWLRDKIRNDGLYDREIASICDVSQSTISTWRRKFDIPTARSLEPIRTCDINGYVGWSPKVNGNSYTVYVHRLLAVAEYGVEAVANNHVHHKNEIRWDNRPENIGLKSPRKHADHHQDNDSEHRYRSRQWLLRKYKREEYSMKEIGDMCDVSKNTIREWMIKFDIERRDPHVELESDAEFKQQTLFDFT